MLRARHAFLDQLLGDGGEIVVDALAMFFQAGAVPLRSELAAAANVGENEDATTLEPRRARRRAVIRCVRYLESTVCAEEGRIAAIELHAITVDDEERNLRPVFRSCFPLFDDQSLGVEHRRQPL